MANWNVGTIRRKLAHCIVLSLMLLVVLGTIATPSASAATPQSGTDGPLYLLCSNAYMYNYPLGNHIATVHSGHRFRVHVWGRDSYNRLWAYGHSGENSDRDGWILASHFC
jgi:hypothetical protein